MYKNTDEVLALHFSNLPRPWLEKVNDKIGKLREENGGDVDMHVRWSKCRPKWMDWILREFCRED